MSKYFFICNICPTYSDFNLLIDDTAYIRNYYSFFYSYYILKKCNQ